jgi:hypothetical protein
MRRRFIILAGIAILVTSAVFAWKIAPRADGYTIEYSPFDPNAVCLFWTEERNTPNPDTGEITSSRASFWLDVASGKVARAENPHVMYFPENTLKANEPEFGTAFFPNTEGTLPFWTQPSKDDFHNNQYVSWTQNGTTKLFGKGRLASSAWSPDRTKVAFSITAANGSIVTIADANGNILSEKNFPNGLHNLQTPFDEQLAWSPDGKFIRVFAFPEPRAFDYSPHVVIMAAQGQTMQVFPLWPQLSITRHWSDWTAQGDTIVLVEQNNNTPYLVFVDAETGVLRRHSVAQAITEKFTIETSFDGKYAALIDTRNGIWVYGLDGTAVKVAEADAPRSDVLKRMRWFPDENKLVYEGKPDEIHRANLILWNATSQQSSLVLKPLYIPVNFAQTPLVLQEWKHGDVKSLVIDETATALKTMPRVVFTHNAKGNFQVTLYEKHGGDEKNTTYTYILVTENLKTGSSTEEILPEKRIVQGEIADSDWLVFIEVSPPSTTEIFNDAFPSDSGGYIVTTLLYNPSSREWKTLGDGYIMWDDHFSSQLVEEPKFVVSSFPMSYSSKLLIFVEYDFQTKPIRQRYVVYGKEGIPVATFVAEPPRSPQSSDGQRIYGTLFSPNLNHVLFVEQHLGQKSIVLGNNAAKLPIPLVAFDSQRWTEPAWVYWSPDNKFLALNWSETNSSQQKTGHLQIYNVDGTLQWQREFKQNTPYNVALQRCGEPIPKQARQG